MAKVDTIEINVGGKDFSFNINVGKAGTFKCVLDRGVARTLGLEYNTVSSDKLSEVRFKILEAHKSYLEATVEYAIFIGIEYKANGYFTSKKGEDNGVLFGRCSNEFYDGRSFGTNNGDSIIFGYGFYARQVSSTGKTNWYEASQIHPDYVPSHGQVIFQGFLFNTNEYSSIPKGKNIPYSVEAEDTLIKGREALRDISEALFNFVNQDELLIEASLRKGKLLKA